MIQPLHVSINLKLEASGCNLFCLALYRKVSVEPEARATGISTWWWLLEASRLVFFF